MNETRKFEEERSHVDYSIIPEHVLHNPTRAPIIVGEVAYIRLTQGMWALTDAIDAELVGEFGKWCAHSHRGLWYAIHTLYNPYRYIGMHTVICEEAYGLFPSDHTADHIHGTLLSPNLLDNRRSNLRLADHRLQGANSHARRAGKTTSRHAGVVWHSRDRVWTAHIRIQGKVYNLGYYSSEEDAAAAYQTELGIQRLRDQMAK